MSVHVYVNDGMGVSVWQDVVVDDDKDAGRGPVPATRAVEDVESLRAMADPTRLAILNALMEPRHGELPIMSAKELAAQLDEPQTKLYRHLKQLEAASLIRVAATRMVSGILEQRYQACQRDLTFGSAFLREHASESEAVLEAMLNRFRDGFFAAFRENDLPADIDQAAAEFRKDPRLPMLFAAESRISPDKAREAKRRLQEFIGWLGEEGSEDPEGVLVDFLIGYYSLPGR
jgi:DNA-binding transcriptional ArsR family regulator